MGVITINMKCSVIIFLALILTIGSAFNFGDRKWKDKTCKDQCTSEYNPGDPCHCNPECVSHFNCCPDYAESCETCTDRCGNGLQNEYPCQCNQKCKDFNDCCPDYDNICSTSPDPEGVTDEELKDITAELFRLIESPPVLDLDLHFQGKTQQGSTTDKAPENLISKLNEGNLFSQPSFEAILPLMDNYITDVRQSEDHTAEEQMEEEVFLDVIVETAIMKKAIEFLIQKNYVANIQEAKKKLKELWFDRYNRDGTSHSDIGTSGFEHVFMGEINNGIVGGFHGWVYWYLEEQ